jgi:hypothetical protein
MDKIDARGYREGKTFTYEREGMHLEGIPRFYDSDVSKNAWNVKTSVDKGRVDSFVQSDFHWVTKDRQFFRAIGLSGAPKELDMNIDKLRAAFINEALDDWQRTEFS